MGVELCVCIFRWIFVEVGSFSMELSMRAKNRDRCTTHSTSTLLVACCVGYIFFCISFDVYLEISGTL